MGYSLWGRQELDMTERLSTAPHPLTKYILICHTAYIQCDTAIYFIQKYISSDCGLDVFVCFYWLKIERMKSLLCFCYVLSTEGYEDS